MSAVVLHVVDASMRAALVTSSNANRARSSFSSARLVNFEPVETPRLPQANSMAAAPRLT